MSYGASRQSRVADTSRQESTVVRRTARATEEDSTLANIQSNTFYKIIVQSGLTPEQKMEEAARALEFSGTKEENRARIKEFDSFKEYIQHVSEEMSKQRIAMTDTETFAELQRVYGDFNNDLNDFIDAMKPLTDITDALYKLRESGQTREALAQIKEDREWDSQYGNRYAALTASITALESANFGMESRNAALAQDKGFFGYGAIKPAALAQIKSNEIQIKQNNVDLERLRSELAALTAEKANKDKSRSDTVEVQKLRELLDLTTEEHTVRQRDLVQRALAFVNNGKERFGSIRVHLDKMGNQIEGLSDNNTNMVQIFAVLNEATKAAEKANQAKREALSQAPEGENLIDKMRRDQAQLEIEEHIGVLSTASVDTMQAYGELTTEAIKLRNMEATTKKQSEAARAMHSRGIASVASQLSTIVTSVNSAAINEAQSMASGTLAEMTRVTNEVAMKESIRIATGRDEVNQDLEAMLQQLADMGDVQKEATAITRDALTRMRQNMAELESLARDVGDDTKDFVAVSADVVAGTTTEQKPATTAPVAAPTSPFKL